MRVRALALFGLFCALTINLCSTDLETAKSQSHKTGASTLSQAESDLLNEINHARSQPQLYATYLENLKPFFNGKEYRPAGQAALTTQEGWAAVEDAIKFLRAAKPIAPLLPAQGLCLAALAHIKDQSSSGATGHAGADRSLIEQRVKAFGSWQGGIGENLGYGNESPRERLLTWLIDDGFATRGHRNRLMSDSYRVVGVSCGPHREYGTMCVVTFAGGFTDATVIQPSQTTDKPKEQ